MRKHTSLKVLIMTLVLCLIVSFQSNIIALAVGIGVETQETDYITAKDWPTAPDIDAEGAVLIEAETGKVLYAKNADTAFYPASITKIMTALLAIENCKLTDEITFEGDALQALPAGYVSIAAVSGETMPMEDWLNALLVLSANDAANALGAYVGGTLSNFADMMNERAKQAGAKNTHFKNPSGLHEEDHYTTPYDMAMIMRDCIQYEEFVKAASTLQYTINTNNKRTEAYTFATRHQMLPKYSSNYYEYAVCGKTGYTTPAGNTLVTYAEKDGMKLICCVMKCGGGGASYTSTRELFEYGFKNFSLCDVSKQDTRYTLSQAGIFKNLNSDSSSLSITLDSDSYLVLPTGVELNDLDTKLTYLNGDSKDGFAEVTYSYEGMEMGTARLYLQLSSSTTSFDFDEHETLDATQEETSQAKIFSSNTIYINIWYLVIALVVLIIIILLILIRRKKNRNKLRF
jgi:D-alanyl-D-alanine carboxypeptidase